MASALLRAFVRSGVCAGADLRIASKTPASRLALADELGATACESAPEAVAGSDLVLVAVRPPDVLPLLAEVGGGLGEKLVVSIATGIPLAAFESAAPQARVFRAMPNTPVEVGAGTTAIVAGTRIRPGDAEIVRSLFSSTGEVVDVLESQMHAVTALSGSGPAYFFLFIEALADAGVAMGLSRDVAQRLAVSTARGSAELAFQTGRHPTLLREKVTSPGGTTAAALAVFESGALRGLVQEALRAAANRSEALSKS